RVVDRNGGARCTRPALLGGDGGTLAGLLPDNVLAWVRRRTRALRDPRTLRACRRRDESLRRDLQRPAVQRWVSRRAPRQPWGSVVAAATASCAERSRQPVAGAAAVAGTIQPRRSRANRPAIANAAAIRRPDACRRVRSGPEEASTDRAGRNRRRRSVSAVVS